MTRQIVKTSRSPIFDMTSWFSEKKNIFAPHMVSFSSTKMWTALFQKGEKGTGTLKKGIWGSRGRMKIIFEMGHLWGMIELSQNFGQHVLTICWLRPPYRLNIGQKWLERLMLTKCVGCFVVGWVGGPKNGFKVDPWDVFRFTKNIRTLSHTLWKIFENKLWWKKVFFLPFFSFLGHF